MFHVQGRHSIRANHRHAKFEAYLPAGADRSILRNACRVQLLDSSLRNGEHVKHMRGRITFLATTDLHDARTEPATKHFESAEGILRVFPPNQNHPAVW